MIIDTKFFGEVEIDEQKIIDFEAGLPAFEEYKRFAVFDMEDDSIFKCLQSIDDKNVAFVMINPFSVFSDYDIDIDDSELVHFKDTDIENFAVYTIVTITRDKITANLLAPVLINAVSRQGRQIILNNSSYSTKHLIKFFEKKE